MKAAVFLKYGAPEVLQVTHVNNPEVKDNDVLVRIFSTAVNSGDVRLRKANPFAVRFLMGLTKPKINILGGVFSGKIESVGKNVQKYKIGDEVFGSTNMKFGAYAEYKTFNEDETFSIKPNNITHAQAAVIPFGGTTALHFLKKANITAGQKVLIYGASGAVGTAAIQLAKYFGAEVTAICSAANFKLVLGLGADHVVDYTKENYLNSLGKFDVIYDTVNKLPIGKALKHLNAKGRLILGSAMMGEMVSGSLQTLFTKKKVVFGVTRQNAHDIKFLADLVEQGKLQPVIDKTYSLGQIADAHAYVDGGHKKGNVAIEI